MTDEKFDDEEQNEEESFAEMLEQSLIGAVELEPGKTKDLLSLENQYDVAKLQSLAGVEALDETEPPQAKVSDSNQSLQLK